MYTAVLKEWTGFVDPKTKQFRLRGRVFGDAKSRLPDGALLLTTAVDFIEDTIVGKVAVVEAGVRYLLVG